MERHKWQIKVRHITAPDTITLQPSALSSKTASVLDLSGQVSIWSWTLSTAIWLVSKGANHARSNLRRRRQPRRFPGRSRRLNGLATFQRGRPADHERLLEGRRHHPDGTQDL